jgi:ABC-type amino acid transport substrate-binding protein
MKKHHRIVWLLVVSALVLAACGSPTPAPTAQPTSAPAQQPTTAPAQPTLIPTKAPPTVAPSTDPTWDRIQASQKIVVGTAADYPPFESYTPDLKLDGFDIALMQKIGEKLGLQVEFNDFAFEGLGSVLQLGQADVVAAAISVTPQRYTYVDFSNLYYVSTDAALAPADSTLTVQSAAELADKKVGVQKGTVYEAWANENIAFASGSGGGVTTYQNVDEMINALKAKQIDVVLLGKQPALSFQSGGGVKIVGESFAKQQYALALPKNSPTLTAKINEALNNLAQDGTLLLLTKKYLNEEVLAIQPLPPLTPEQPTAPAACVDGLAYVADLTYDDQNLTAPPAVQPGEAFVKSWRIQNVGTCPWTPQYLLHFTYGNTGQSAMGGVATPLTKNVNPGETYDMSVNLVAPKDPGTYTAVWNMHNAEGAAFGESLWVAISVPGTPPVATVPATTLDFDVKLMSCQNNLSSPEAGAITLTLQFQPTGGTDPYHYFDMDEGIEVPQTYDRPGGKGTATIVAFGVLSGDGQGMEKKIQFPPSTFGPAGCQ